MSHSAIRGRSIALQHGNGILGRNVVASLRKLGVARTDREGFYPIPFELRKARNLKIWWVRLELYQDEGYLFDDGGGSGVGRIINADAGTVDIQGAGGLLVNGITGIGTSTPDASSILDVSSNSKGFLMPRLPTVERDAITLPATGLMIYNHTLNDGQLNIGPSPTDTSEAEVNTPAPSPKRMEKLAPETLAVAKSCIPSPLKSPMAIDLGSSPTDTSETEVNPPNPSPKRMETSSSLLMTVAKSCIPSALKSPMAIDRGSSPTDTSVAEVKPPVPSPNRMETSSSFLIGCSEVLHPISIKITNGN
jgi:hypothetical protein